MEKVRTTLVLEKVILQKLREESENNISDYVNQILRKELFKTKRNMFGALKGRISAKDMIEDEE